MATIHFGLALCLALRYMLLSERNAEHFWTQAQTQLVCSTVVRNTGSFLTQTQTRTWTLTQTHLKIIVCRMLNKVQDQTGTV